MKIKCDLLLSDRQISIYMIAVLLPVYQHFSIPCSSLISVIVNHINVLVMHLMLLHKIDSSPKVKIMQDCFLYVHNLVTQITFCFFIFKIVLLFIQLKMLNQIIIIYIFFYFVKFLMLKVG